jgi:hypothetical protein
MTLRSRPEVTTLGRSNESSLSEQPIPSVTTGEAPPCGTWAELSTTDWLTTGGGLGSAALPIGRAADKRSDADLIPCNTDLTHC